MGRSKAEINGARNAFPEPSSRGLTKREHFAGLAMQGCRARGGDYKSWADLSTDAVEMADALLQALSEKD